VAGDEGAADGSRRGEEEKNGDSEKKNGRLLKKAVAEGGEAALVYAQLLAKTTEPPSAEEPFPPGSEVDVACFLLPTDFLFPETFQGDWSPGWVLASPSAGSPSERGDSSGSCSNGSESYTVVTDDGEVEEELDRACLRLRE
jgi:hypothetical protein